MVVNRSCDKMIGETQSNDTVLLLCVNLVSWAIKDILFVIGIGMATAGGIGLLLKCLEIL